MRNAEFIRTEPGWKQRAQSESHCIIQTSKEIRTKAEDRRDGKEGVVSRNIYRLTSAGPDEQSDMRVGGARDREEPRMTLRSLAWTAGQMAGL